MIEINFHPSQKDLRVFAVLQVVFFCVVAGFVYTRTNSTVWPAGVVAASVVVGVAGWFRPTFMRVVYVAWMVAVFPIGWVVSHVLMAAIYFGLFTPIGLCMRMCGYDPLKRRFDRDASTYWERRPEQTDPQRYFRQY